MYADIIVNISSESIDKTFQYLIPESMREEIRPGVPVTVPFGQNRMISGYVIDISEEPKISPDRIKPINSVSKKKNGMDSETIELAWWIKEQFGSTMNAALKTVVPVSSKIKRVQIRTIVALYSEEELNSLLAQAIKRRAVAQERFLRELISLRSLDYDLTVGKMNIPTATINKFRDMGAIRIDTQETYRNPFKAIDRSGYKKPELNTEQAFVAGSIKSEIEAGKRRDYLIHGVTGSGKTEVYMDIIDAVIAKGRQVIMLIPEIALTYQTVKRFYLRFGDRISIMNSKLSPGERYDQYLRAKNGDTDIVIGPRSALFTPFDRLGLIIIDEEHEASYHSETPPCYSAREVAFHRGEMTGASVILGSATPSLESFTMARAGRIGYFKLDKRAGEAKFPTVHVVDMRNELKLGNRSVFSIELKSLLAERLERHEQTMLFLNRRGYSGIISCRSCGKVIKCPHCDVSMTLHKRADNTQFMMCHYCGFSLQVPSVCPECGSPYIGTLGLGTQKVEELLLKSFPKARVLRMDADTTRSKESYEQILSSFANGEADVLIGTQMIVKGHDFHRVTLVGILMADMSLHSPDFRAGEKTFQLITQASGRAGRGELAGDVVIQTYDPEHYCIETASRADYESFYEEEFAYRKLMKYPPSHVMLSVLVMSEDEQCAENYLGELAKLVPGEKNLRTVGPAKAPLPKANDLYRRILYIKSDDYSALVKIKDSMVLYTDKHHSDNIFVQYNFN